MSVMLQVHSLHMQLEIITDVCLILVNIGRKFHCVFVLLYDKYSMLNPCCVDLPSTLCLLFCSHHRHLQPQSPTAPSYQSAHFLDHQLPPGQSMC